jgi:hypothetical protein
MRFLFKPGFVGLNKLPKTPSTIVSLSVILCTTTTTTIIIITMLISSPTLLLKITWACGRISPKIVNLGMRSQEVRQLWPKEIEENHEKDQPA